MTKRLTEQDWIKVKTEYEFAEKSIRQIATEFGISEGTIRVKVKKENWTQKLRTQVIDLKRNIQEITQNITHAQIPIVQEKLNDILQLQTKVRSFIAKAIEVNLMNMEAVANEPDPVQRIKLTAAMRANMIDLPNIIPTVREVENQHSDSEEKKDSVINIIIE